MQNSPTPTKNRPWLNADDTAKLTSPSTGMLMVFGRLGYRIYEGTVPAAVKATRRRRNKAARIARRSNR